MAEIVSENEIEKGALSLILRDWIPLGIFAYVTGNINFSSYLEIPYVEGAGEIFVFCASIAGAGLGFLWFNTYPAQVFMGDVGSLSLGAALGVVAVIIKQEECN